MMRRIPWWWALLVAGVILVALLRATGVKAQGFDFFDAAFVASLEPPAAEEEGGGGCDTAIGIFAGTATGNISTEVAPYLAQVFTCTNAVTVCKVVVKGLKHGTPTGRTLRLGLWTVSGGEPDTVIDWSDTIDATTTPATEGDVTFDVNLSAALSASTSYAVVIQDSGGGTFDGAGFRWSYLNAPSFASYNSADGSTWGETSPSNPHIFTLHTE